MVRDSRMDESSWRFFPTILEELGDDPSRVHDHWIEWISLSSNEQKREMSTRQNREKRSDLLKGTKPFKGLCRVAHPLIKL